MDLDGMRFLVAGATSEFGSALAHELSGQGSELGLLGRDQDRLESLGDELGASVACFDARERAAIPGAVDAVAADIGGLDGLVVACGVAAFGAAGEVGSETLDEVFAVNALAPIELVASGIPHLPNAGGAIVGVTAIVAEYPTSGTAAFSASKAAFSAYLAVLRHERRQAGGLVLEVRPPHMSTGFTDRALTGEPPPLPEPVDHREVVAETVAALRDERRELAWDLEADRLVAR